MLVLRAWVQAGFLKAQFILFSIIPPFLTDSITPSFANIVLGVEQQQGLHSWLHCTYSVAASGKRGGELWVCYKGLTYAYIGGY